jgi:hypothetical protein
VVDSSEFGAEGFDPKQWINAALDARHPSEPLDRFLADAEERLRAAADDAAAALERDSGDALRRVPLACRDALRLRDDAVSLRAQLASVLQSLSLVRASVPLPRSLLDLNLTGAFSCEHNPKSRRITWSFEIACRYSSTGSGSHIPCPVMPPFLSSHVTHMICIQL